MSMEDDEPIGLHDSEMNILSHLKVEVDTSTIDELAGMATDYVRKVLERSTSNPLIDCRRAEQILGQILAMQCKWDEVDRSARPWCKAAVLYFVTCDDDEDDLRSAIGFDDDSAVMNACLRLAKLHSLCSTDGGTDAH